MDWSTVRKKYTDLVRTIIRLADNSGPTYSLLLLLLLCIWCTKSLGHFWAEKCRKSYNNNNNNNRSKLATSTLRWTFSSSHLVHGKYGKHQNSFVVLATISSQFKLISIKLQYVVLSQRKIRVTSRHITILCKMSAISQCHITTVNAIWKTRKTVIIKKSTVRGSYNYP
jgi:isoprenylcysteine carboxyl methyltransferase (ICMT) family protein YpbQ